MNKRDREKCKKVLLEMKQQIQDKIYDGVSERYSGTQKEASGDLSVMPSHMADLGTDSFDRDMRLNIASGDSDLLSMVDEALLKVDDKSFGECIGCNKKITAERIVAMPYVMNCIECQEKLEQTGS